MNGKLDSYESFVEKQNIRTKLPISGEIQAILDYCEFVIHTEIDKKSKTKYRFKQRKNQICEDFMRAFETLSMQQKIKYYIKNVNYFIRIHNGNSTSPIVGNDILESTLYTKKQGLKFWKQKKIKLINQKQIIEVQKKKSIRVYDLGDYIVRNSKNTKYPTFVIEAIKDAVNEQSKTIYFGFDEEDQMKVWLNAVQLCIDFKLWQKIYNQMHSKQDLLHDRRIVSQKFPQHQGQTRNTQQSQTSFGKKTSVENLISNTPSKINKYFVSQLFQPNKSKHQKKSRSKNMSNSKNSISSESPEKQASFQINEIGERTIIEDLVDGQFSESNMQVIESRNIKQRENKNMKHLNIFHKMFPEYEFSQIEWEGNQQMIYNEKNLRIMLNTKQKNKYKMVMEFANSKQTTCQYIFKSLCNPQFQLSYNTNVEQVSIKTMISSQNSAIMYMILKPFSRIYRGRDFVFIRHAFSIGNSAYYIADKDIENSNFPPFITIVRGKYECVWAILKKQQNKIRVIGDIYMDNQGYLNQNQNSNLVLNYLRGYRILPQFIQNNKQKLSKYVLFDFNWDITKNKQNEKENQLRIKRKKGKIRNLELEKIRKTNQIQSTPTFIKDHKKYPHRDSEKLSQINNFEKQKNNKQGSRKFVKQKQKIMVPQEQENTSKRTIKQSTKSSPKQQHYFDDRQNITNSFQKSFHSRRQDVELQRQKMNAGQVQPQVDPQQLKKQKSLETNNVIKLNFDSKGLVIIPKQYLKTRYQLQPTKTYHNCYWTAPGTHPLPEDQWKHDTKVGGFLFTNQKKIDDQKGVLKFILSKIGKNLLTGKSILNISLPVDIFVAKSNLQLFLDSICYAPTLLEKVVACDPMEKFKMTTAFGITMSILYLRMQKPFNPILGETFQAWIHGSPAYAEQISHHPPISALQLYGRGYTLSGQFQSKAQLHMNSGTGTNDGIFHINFDDGTKICYCSAGGEVSGVMYGDRKFNVIGKAYTWSETQEVFAEIIYNPSKKGFFSIKKQQQTEDYFQGQVYKVTSKFLTSLYTKRKAPSQKEILSKLGKFSGIWHNKICYQNEQLLDVLKIPPFKLQYEKNPLPSDANYREDIAYRRLMEIPRAQAEKQRLEILQRADKKLRTNKK